MTPTKPTPPAAPPRQPPTARPAPRTATRTVADVLRGTGALVALLAALGGVPWALATLGGPPLPAGLPTAAELVDALTRPDDGSLFLRTLLLAGWAGWAAFALSVAVEIPAQLRGRTAPRLPALGASQRAAAALVAAVAVLLVTGPTLPAPAVAGRTTVATDLPRPAEPADPARRPAARAPAEPPEQTAAPTAAGTGSAGPTYRVRRQDTLWDIAERCLGAGERFTEIAALNYGVTQPDGRTLTSAHWIYPGWVLRLPPDARLDPGPANQGGRPVGEDGEDGEDGEHSRAYTVGPGDTLWDIAADQLGAPDRYGEITALNTGRPQPDGQRLRDPHHIEPGWQLHLPDTHGAATAGADRHRPATAHQEPQHERPPRPSPDTAMTAPPAADWPPGDTATDAHVDPRGAADEATPRGDQGDPGGAGDGVEDTVPAKVGLGMSGITAAALLAALARRRALQQRARPPGRRIALPGTAARTAETRLRAADDRDALTRLRAALLELARGCAQAGRDLPALAAVRLTRTTIELRLLHDDPEPVPPFTAAAADQWRADPAAVATPDTDGEPAAPEGDVPFPYPALLTVHASDDATLLVDLETAGTLTAVGNPDDVRPVLNAWAVELAAAPVWDTVGVTLVGGGWPGRAVDAARVRLVDSPAVAARRATVRARDVTAVLHAAHVTTVRQARSRRVGADVWDPEVVLCGAGPGDPGLPADLLSAAGAGVAVVAAVTNPAQVPRGWTLTATGDGDFRLEPLGLTVILPRLTTPDLNAVADLLETAHDQDGLDPPRSTAPSEDSLLPVDSTPYRNGRAEVTDGPAGESSAAGAPRILVLGPVEVQVPENQDTDPARRRKLTELAAFVALHPGADNHGIDDALWPTRRVSPSTRNSATSRLRRWLGDAPDGQPWLPVVPDRGHYRFRPEVRCDWHDFQALTRRGLAAGSAGLDDLDAALALVRGRPFTGIDPACYTWAEYDIQEMISAVTDVAHALSAARLAAGDPHGARAAAARGLLVEPCSELLTRDAIRAASALGDAEAARRLVEQLRQRLSVMDPDADVWTDTVDLVRTLTKA